MFVNHLGRKTVGNVFRNSCLRGQTPSKCSQDVLKIMPVCPFTFSVAVQTQ